MDRIFTLLRALVAGLLAAPVPGDPIAEMCPRELADLPVYHPRR